MPTAFEKRIVCRSESNLVWTQSSPDPEPETGADSYLSCRHVCQLPGLTPGNPLVERYGSAAYKTLFFLLS